MAQATLVEYLVDLMIRIDADEEMSDRVQAELWAPGSDQSPVHALAGQLIVTTVLAARDEHSAVEQVCQTVDKQLAHTGVPVLGIRSASIAMDELLARHDIDGDLGLSELDLGQLLVTHLDSVRHRDHRTHLAQLAARAAKTA